MGGLRKTRGRAAILPTNLLSLQNLLKRDPPSYKEEFVQQLNHYKTTLQIFKQNPSNRSTEFTELIGFLAQVSSCFPEETADFPNDLAHLLSKHHNVLDIDLREKLVQNLVLLRNKSVISSISLLQTFFPILAVTNSKLLRAQIYESIVSTIKAENLKGKNMTLNKMIQSILFDMVQKDEASGVWAIRLTKELWSKNIWAGDARVAEICKNAALSLHTKVMLGGIYFFLGVDADDMEDDEDESNEIDLRRMQHQAGINKLSKNRAQRVKKAMVSDKKKRMSKKTPAILNFSALQILHDPQSFAEKLFSIHLASKRPLPFDHKLLLVTLLARLMGTHKLTLLGFYSFLQKWISPHQRDVTKILASLAGASHEFVPPEILSPVIKKIANEFVTTGVSPEVVCAGLNAIREICTRNPLCMDATLLQDLTEYKGSKDKGVMMASRSLITLYRDAAPEMLSKKDRGKTATMGLAAGTKESTQFGVERGVTRGIEGLELLEEFYAQKAAEKGLDPDDEGVDSDSDDGWAGFDVEDSDSDEGGTGWINVESDGEDLEFSDDSDDEDTKATKQVQKNATKTVKFADEEENDPKLVKGDGETAAKALEVSDASEKVDAEETNLRSIAMTRILTPADFKRLAELKAAVPGKKTHHSASAKRNAETGEFVNELDIEGPRKKAKQDLEARLASVAEGRKDREKFGSRKGQRSEEGRSTTNREKARKKNFLMVKHRKDIQGKSMKKLTIKRKELKAHIDRGRRGGKRGNK